VKVNRGEIAKIVGKVRRRDGLGEKEKHKVQGEDQEKKGEKLECRGGKGVSRMSWREVSRIQRE